MVHNWDWAYEKIHKVHHEYETPFALSAPYSHWSDVLILSSPALVGPAMVPCHIITYWLWFILRHMEALDTHSGYEFPWSPTKYIPFYVGAKYHDYHHYVGGRSKCNFSTVFTYCDYLYGTNKGYQHAKQIGKKTPSTYNSIDENHSKVD
ncbi:Methylsterol monooxygenase 1-1 [Stylosanthes scabra]|uniref:Methylsterol monooxygenase 1-1 n=1 Tax=Stylosanthes scabra TaxID=79078 RepID=A0ABU6T9I4_9FABA|nr:Methylsterol monooxygenase 1-1 [Stylosanthes scabra]